MELQTDQFKESLIALLASPRVAVFGSLPACRFGHDLPFVGGDQAAFRYRDSNPNQIESQCCRCGRVAGGRIVEEYHRNYW